MARRRARRSLAFLPSRLIAAPGVRDHRPALNTVPSKPACSGFPMKIILPLGALKSTLISASAARSALVKDRMALSWTVVPGMLSKWCPLKTGRVSTESRCQTLRLVRRRLSRLTSSPNAALNGFCRQGRLLFYAVRGNCVLCVPFSHRQII